MVKALDAWFVVLQQRGFELTQVPLVSLSKTLSGIIAPGGASHDQGDSNLRTSEL